MNTFFRFLQRAKKPIIAHKVELLLPTIAKRGISATFTFHLDHLIDYGGNKRPELVISMSLSFHNTTWVIAMCCDHQRNEDNIQT
jgi:hypothetical protein